MSNALQLQGPAYADDSRPPRTAAARQQQLPGSQHTDHRGHSVRQATDASRRLQQLGTVYDDMPADFLGLESILAAARDAFTFFEPHMLQPSVSPQYPTRSRSLGGISRIRGAAGQGDVMLAISFKSAHPDVEVGLRLPAPPRTFNVTVIPLGSGGSQQQCSHDRVPYGDQELLCAGMASGSKWQATLVDAGGQYILLLVGSGHTLGLAGRMDGCVGTSVQWLQLKGFVLAWSVGNCSPQYSVTQASATSRTRLGTLPGSH